MRSLSSLSSVGSQAKYLGVRLGPGAGEVQWKAASNKFVGSVGIVRAERLGLPRTIMLYNWHCHCLAFLGTVACGLQSCD